MLATSSSGSKNFTGYDQTLNKQGQIPQSKEKKGIQMTPVINPKELTNEELEFIIKTG
jgi:hypothetical protein